jgi:uncharacterized protein YabN with tetrapyrrole methylase and pyrophosphatase domain
VIADELKDENRALAKREAQVEQLKRELQSAFKLRDLAWMAIKNGCDPAYVSMRYGFPLEDMKHAKEIHEAREAERVARYESRDVGDRQILRGGGSAEGSEGGETNAEGTA